MEEDDNYQINLLDLPYYVLEKIFSYCSLKTLTQCNKFIKNMVETGPGLRSRLYLSLEIPFGTLEQENLERMKACLESTRKYDYLVISHESERHVFAEKDPELNMQALLYKHAATVKKIYLFMSTYSIHSVINVMEYLRNLVNLEDIDLNFYGNIDDRQNVAAIDDFPNPIDFSFPNNNFMQLKILNLDINTSTVFSTFKNCTGIESVNLTTCSDMALDLTDFYLILTNCQENLQHLSFESNTMKDNEIRHFFEELKKSQLNLKIFELIVRDFKNTENNTSLMEFLKTQKNLEEFNFTGIVDLDFVKKFSYSLSNFRALKEINFYFFRCNWDDSFSTFSPWNLDRLEKLELYCYKIFGHELTAKLFHTSSLTLKEIIINGLNFQGNLFINIPQNYPNLVKLRVNSQCVNYSSNDIFLILKNLKKLQNLLFHFPKNSPLNPELFETNENLNLPEIEDVRLEFNKSIHNDEVGKFMDLLNNMSSFRIHFWANFNDKTLDIVTRKLPKLENLFAIDSFKKVQHSVLVQIDSNIRQFNVAPHLFKYNWETIESLINLAQQQPSEMNDVEIVQADEN